MNQYRKFTWHFGQMKILGIFQILLGSVCIMMSIPYLVMFSKRQYDYNLDYLTQTLTFISSGIWGGSCSLIAGVLGVILSTKSSKCYIVTQLIASILAFLAASAMLGIEVAQTIVANSYDCLNNPFSYICQNYQSWELDPIIPAAFAFMYYLTMCLLALSSVIVAAIQSGYGCRVASGGVSTTVNPVPTTRMNPQQLYIGSGGDTGQQRIVPMQMYQLQPIGFGQQVQHTAANALSTTSEIHQNPGFIQRESTLPLIHTHQNPGFIQRGSTLPLIPGQTSNPSNSPSGNLKREITLPPIQAAQATGQVGHIKREVTLPPIGLQAAASLPPIQAAHASGSSLPPIQTAHTSGSLPPIQTTHSARNVTGDSLMQDLSTPPTVETSDSSSDLLDSTKHDVKLPPIVQLKQEPLSNVEPETQDTDKGIPEVFRDISHDETDFRNESPDFKQEGINDTQDERQSLKDEYEEGSAKDGEAASSVMFETAIPDDNPSSRDNEDAESNPTESRAASPLLHESVSQDERRLSQNSEDEQRRAEEAAEAERKEKEDELRRLEEEEKLKRLSAAAAKRREKEEKKKARREARRAEKEAKAMEEKERLRFILEDAIDGDDQSSLESAINEYKSAKSKHQTSNDILEKAERLLQMLQSREALKEASHHRTITDLEGALQKVRNMGFHHSEDELAQEFAHANELLERLKRIEVLRSEVMELQQSTIAEIRSYQNPIPAVHNVMIATYLLLGIPAKQTKKWSNIQSLLGKTGREGLKRKISQCNINDISPSDALKARSVMGDADLEVIRDASAGAATFYVWVESMIEEVLTEE